MSRENVEAIRESYDHFNRTGEPMCALFDSDAEFDATAIVGFDVIHGRDRVLASIREYGESFEDWRMEPEEILDAGDQVVAVVRDGGRLKGTTDDIFNLFVHVFTFRSGRIVRWKTFLDRAEALEAAGLRE